MFDMDVKTLTLQEKEDLINKTEIFLKDLKVSITEDSKDNFELWLKYADKKHFNYLIQDSDSELLRDYLVEYRDIDRFYTIHLDCVLDELEWKYKDKEITKEEFEEYKSELMRVNFGSMEYDW